MPLWRDLMLTPFMWPKCIASAMAFSCIPSIDWKVEEHQISPIFILVYNIVSATTPNAHERIPSSQRLKDCRGLHRIARMVQIPSSLKCIGDIATERRKLSHRFTLWHTSRLLNILTFGVCILKDKMGTFWKCAVSINLEWFLTEKMCCHLLP